MNYVCVLAEPKSATAGAVLGMPEWGGGNGGVMEADGGHS